MASTDTNSKALTWYSSPSIRRHIPMAMAHLDELLLVLNTQPSNLAAAYHHCQYRFGVSNEEVAEIPKVIFVDSTNSPHLADLGPETNDLNADVRAVLDSHAFVICVLRRCCVRIILASLGDELKAVSTNVAGP